MCIVHCTKSCMPLSCLKKRCISLGLKVILEKKLSTHLWMGPLNCKVANGFLFSEEVVARSTEQNKKNVTVVQPSHCSQMEQHSLHTSSLYFVEL